MCQSIAITLKRKNNNPLQVKIEGKITSEFLHGSLSLPLPTRKISFFWAVKLKYSSFEHKGQHLYKLTKF